MILSFLFAVVAHAAPFYTNSTSRSGPPSSSLVDPPTITQLAEPGTTLWISGTVTVTPWLPCFQDTNQDCSRSGEPYYSFTSAIPGVGQNLWDILLNSESDMFNVSNAQKELISSCAISYDNGYKNFWSTAPIVFDTSLVPGTTMWVSEPARTYEKTDYYDPASTSTSYWFITEIEITSLGASDAVTTVDDYYTDSLGFIHETSVEAYWSVNTVTDVEFEGYSTSIETITASPINQPDWIWNAYYPAYYATPYTPTTDSTCCLWCTIFGGTVQVYHWPTSSASLTASTITTLVNSQGFKFTSPSVYIAFQSLFASNLCGPIGGNDSAATTLAFNSDDLSTAPDYSFSSTSAGLPSLNVLFTAASWRDASDCAEITQSFYQNLFQAPATETTLPTSWLTSGSVAADFPLYTVSYNPCEPLLSVPNKIYSINDAWTDCKPAFSVALFDPPYILSPVSGLTVFQVTQQSDPPVGVSTTSAAPQQSPAPNIPTITNILSVPTPTPTPTQSPVPPGTLPSSAAIDPPTSSSSKDLPAIDSASSISTVFKDPPTQTNPDPIDPAILSLGTTTLIADSASAFILPDSQTLTPGGQITYSSTVLSLATNGASIIFGGTTTLSLPYTSPAQYQVGSQTLIAGGPAVTVSGTVLSLAPGGASVVIDGTTKPLSAIYSSMPEYIIDGSQTLQVGGPAITVSGTVVSLLAGGESVVLGGGTKTEALSVFLGKSTTEIEVGIGGIIETIGGFAWPTPTVTSTSVGPGGANGSYNGTVFAGDARGRVRVEWLLGIVLGAAGLGCFL